MKLISQPATVSGQMSDSNSGHEGLLAKIALQLAYWQLIAASA